MRTLPRDISMLSRSAAIFAAADAQALRAAQRGNAVRDNVILSAMPRMPGALLAGCRQRPSYCRCRAALMLPRRGRAYVNAECHVVIVGDAAAFERQRAARLRHAGARTRC